MTQLITLKDITPEMLKTAQNIVRYIVTMQAMPTDQRLGMTICAAILALDPRKRISPIDFIRAGLYDGLSDGLRAGFHAGLSSGLDAGLSDGLDASILYFPNYVSCEGFHDKFLFFNASSPKARKLFASSTVIQSLCTSSM